MVCWAAWHLPQLTSLASAALLACCRRGGGAFCFELPETTCHGAPTSKVEGASGDWRRQKGRQCSRSAKARKLAIGKAKLVHSLQIRLERTGHGQFQP